MHDGGIAARDGCGYTSNDDESQSNTRVLLPDDFERPLSTLADSSLTTPHYNI